MKKSLLLLFAFALAFTGQAQEDDVYFVPSSKNLKKEQMQREELRRSSYTALPTDAETFESSSWAEGRSCGGRDVDAYNRRDKHRGAEVGADTAAADEQTGRYTERIVRFHSPRGVVVSSPYYVDYYDYCYDPFFYDPWRYTWYSPWYVGVGWSSWYGPSWSWGWGFGSWYDPWYCYGPSWGWGWGHHHYYGWGPGHGWGWGWGHDWAYRPSNAVGATHNRGWVSYGNGRRPSSEMSSSRYNSLNRRPSNRYEGTTGRPSRYNNTESSRPSRPNNSQPSRSYNSETSRPSRSYNSQPSRSYNSGSSVSRPSRSSGGYSPSRSGGGGRRGR